MGFQCNDTLYRLVVLRNIELSTQLHGTTFINKESIDYSVGSCPEKLNCTTVSCYKWLMFAQNNVRSNYYFAPRVFLVD